MKFEPIRTQRLVIRAFEVSDTDELLARRNDPAVSLYQDWTVPFPMSRAKSLVESIVAMDGPENDEWWMAVVADKESGEVYGDLVVHLTSDSRTAEIGYTMASAHWGRGYAAESVRAWVDYLFDTVGVTRVFAMLHPDNTASAMVLERTGFLFEGHTVLSYWLEDEASDDWIYGMTKPDRDRWVGRDTSRPESVTLEEITAENLDAVYALRTHRSQEAFVAPVPRSIAQGSYPGEYDGHPISSWLRAIYADGEATGFVMMAERTEVQPTPYLWRFLIDREHQRRGIGRRALDLVVAEAESSGATELLVSWHEGKGSPAAFYIEYGFEPTGNVVDDETEGKLTIGQGRPAP